MLDEFHLVILDPGHRISVYIDQVFKDISAIPGPIIIIFNDYFPTSKMENHPQLTQISTAAFAAKFQSKRGKYPTRDEFLTLH